MSSFAAARVISTKKRFVVGGTNGRERDRSQVSNGKVERMLRAQLLLGWVLCVKTIGPLSGVPCFPFYRPKESRDYRWEKRGKREANEVLQERRVFLFLCAGPADMAGSARDRSTLGACPLILIGPRWAPVR